MSNYTKRTLFRGILILIITVSLLLPSVCGALGAAVNYEQDPPSVISKAPARSKNGEIQRILLEMRACENTERKNGIYGDLSFSALASFPNISIGFDIDALRKDLKNFDLINEDEQKVIEATYISAYKQVLVIKLPMGYNGASFGVIFLGDKITSIQTVRHEYGHTRQLKDMGLYLYIVDVAITSIIGNILDRNEKLPYDYYGSYWEAGADELGMVSRESNNEKWPTGADSSIWKLCAMFD